MTTQRIVPVKRKSTVQDDAVTTDYGVKVRPKSSKTFKFLTPRGGLNSLRVHAVRFKHREAAQECCDKSAPQNPDTEWKVVEL